MELRDALVAPFVFCLIYLGAYLIRPYATNEINEKYFIPGLTVRIFGALALGLIYQFYYHGGDTYNFHTHGSRHIWEAFFDSPEKGFKMLFSDGTYQRDTFRYASRIPFFTDKSSYTVIKIAAFFDLLTFSAYAGTALFFAVISFIGSWCLFLTFYPLVSREMHRYVAVITLFMPSVFFWGSGLMKDTITLSCISIATYLIKRIFIDKRIRIISILLLLITLYLTYKIKVYILLTFLPAAIFWVCLCRIRSLRSKVLQLLVLPAGLILAFVFAYFAINQVSNVDSRYRLDNLAETARTTAYDIAYLTGQDAGSTYSLGELDGTFSGMLRLAPQAINVALFRPYLWEVRNPLMLMTALESMMIFVVFILVVIRSLRYLGAALSNSHVIFCLVFSLTFAFAVGVSTFNFGTLSRYKIPLIPFFLLALVLIYDYSNRARKFGAFAFTE